MNIVVCDAKTGKAYPKKLDDAAPFLNKKIGDTVELSALGLDGFEARITGGSDKDGFPMRSTLHGAGRKKILSFKGVGFRQSSKGERRKKSVRGSVVSRETAQLNLVVTKYGSRPLDEAVGKIDKKVEEKKSLKEEMVEKSLAAVGDVAAAEEAKKIKGKVKG